MFINRSIFVGLVILISSWFMRSEVYAAHSKYSNSSRSGIYCVDSAGQFELRVATDGKRYSQARLSGLESPNQTLVARTISTMLYPDMQVEIVQLFANEPLRNGLSLNLVKSYDCVHAQSGKVYPLRALIMMPESNNSPLLPMFTDRDVCCQKIGR
jgi:hypothetical protein